MSEHTHPNILFSDYFDIDKDVVEEYGAFNISLVADLPLFIDPFLLFNSEKTEYKALHDEIIRYLNFLRDKSVSKSVTPGLRNAWYRFKEVKQTWLGFSRGGNSGSGLGTKFAVALDTNFHRLFGDGDGAAVTKGKHLEKLCLISSGVGKDNISDFTTNLIKEFLLSYTQDFARQHIAPEFCKTTQVTRVRFNYKTESWETRPYYLPHVGSEFVILVPKDLLTRDDTWINRTDLIASLESLPDAIPDEDLRAQINNYFQKMLPEDADSKAKKEAAQSTILEFPQLIDYYILDKEDNGEKAVSISSEKVAFAEILFLENFSKLAALSANKPEFSEYEITSYEGAVARIECLKAVIEREDGYPLLYNADGTPVSREKELEVLYRFLWFAGLGERVNAKDVFPVSFKLASNNVLGNYLQKKDKELQEAGDTTPTIVVIFHFSDAERQRAENHVKTLKSRSLRVVYIDASKPDTGADQVTSATKNPQVFISYSHDRDVWERLGKDPDTQRKRVFDLAERLRGEGVECVFDQQVVNPPEGWPRWMMNQIEEADFVLVVGTETYNKRFRGKEEPGRGLGAQWEGLIINQEIYDASGRNEKFIPIVFDSDDVQHIPLPLRSATHHNVSRDSGYDDLYFYVTHQPPYVPKPLGPIRKRPTP